jgi:ATP-dependent 26S proteasome regulatory subunit
MLSVLDGHTLEEGIIFVMTTNYVEKLDPALTRPGTTFMCVTLI